MNRVWTGVGVSFLVLGSSPAHGGQVISGRIVDRSGGDLRDTEDLLPNLLNPAPNDAKSGVRADATDPVRYGVALEWDTVAPITLAFDVQNDGDANDAVEYSYSTNFTNESGVDWHGMTIELGYLNDNNAFVPGTFPGLDFDTSALDDFNPAPPVYILDDGLNISSYFGPGLPPAPQVITGGLIEIDATAFLDDRIWSSSFPSSLRHFAGFSVDVPNTPELAEWQSEGGGYSFAIRYTPVAVPEPASATIFALCSAGLLRRGRR